MRIAGAVLSVILLILPRGAAFAETVRYSYDAAGRLIQVSYPDRTLEYAYDSGGNLLSRTVVVPPLPIGPTLAVQRVGDELTITYATGACVSSDHALFMGLIGDFGTVTSADCSIGSSGQVSIPLPAGNVWFLVAGVEGDRYSSVGNGASGERVLTGVEAFCPTFTADTSRSCP